MEPVWIGMVINSGVIVYNNLDKLFQWNFSPTSLSSLSAYVARKKNIEHWVQLPTMYVKSIINQ